MLESIMLEDYCDSERALKLAQRVLASPLVKESIAKKETVFLLGAELQLSTPGATLAEVEDFKPEFEALRIWLEKRLAANIEYHPKLPLPGFHLHFTTAKFGGKVHADGQAFSVANYLENPFLSAWSIVLSLNSPSSGGGVHFWKKSPTEFAREWGSLENPVPAPDFTVTLDPGKILLFQSRLIHQIEGFEIENLDEARVTLIAHLGEIEPGRFVYFWDRIRNVKSYLEVEPQPDQYVLDRFGGKLSRRPGN